MSAAPHWFKSSYSTEQGGNCVEVAVAPTAIHIRDSKDSDGPHLSVTPATWANFTAFAATREYPA
ncbi:DUF397 domain-containing protein [Streptomyces sp. NPDC042319]|uniref:DUF397 domain-containing protein n=1 Tax=Streptomyces sp. NPDC042319 TaxID=3154332 RepID=UPI0033DAAFA5